MVRSTQQRKAIINAIVTSNRPVSVNEVYERAKSEVCGIGIATIYRNLKALQKEEQIIQVDVPGQPPRWELNTANHHHHFLCRTCDKLFEIHACLGNIKRLLPEGYTLEEHDILLHGQCDACAGKTDKS